MGWGSVLAYPLTVNKDTWAKIPDDVKKIIMEEVEVYEKAVENESETKFVTALDNLRKQGVTVRNIDPETQLQMARAIEPWVNQKAQEYEDQGFPGKATFKRLIDLAQENGAKPVHVYTIK